MPDRKAATPRVLVKLPHWDRPYSFRVTHETICGVRSTVMRATDGPDIPYDYDTLRACAREKGSTWEILL